MASIWDDLGVRPVLNLGGNRTLLGGNEPPPEVREIMAEMDDYYVDMSELIDAASEKVAELLGVEAALITSGASAALAVGAAGIMTGTDEDKIDRIPDTTGMRNEFLIQRQLRVKYDRCITAAGASLVEIGDADETRPEHLEDAIGPNTAAVHYFAPGNRPDCLPVERVIDIAHSKGLAVIVDAAGQVYPTENMTKYVNMGADLVAYGAKYFGAVNASGILTGKTKYVEAARMNSFINFESTRARNFARTMKLDRQSVVAVYAALRRWLTMNHEDRFAVYEVQLNNLRSGLAGIPGITLEPADDGPTDGVVVYIDPDETGKTADQVREEMKNGNPSVWTHSSEELGGRPGGFVMRVRTLKPGQEDLVAERLREIL